MGRAREEKDEVSEKHIVPAECYKESSVKVCTNDHPDGEADPRPQVQLHHEIDVDEDTEEGQPGQQRDLQETAAKKFINGGSVHEAVLSL